MSFSDLYSSGFKNRNRDHFAAIVRVALSDDIITDQERAFINRLAISLEIDEDEKEAILANPDAYPVNPPANDNRRKERLYDLARMVYADHIADDEEKALLRRFVVGLGFAADQAESVAERALQLVDQGLDEDDFVATF